MSAELALRLRDAERVDPRVLEACLFASVRQRVSLVRVLLDHVSGAATLLEGMLSRPEFPHVGRVDPPPELTESLPKGMCWNLLALPIRRDPGTGRIDIAVADPLDPHAAEELAFHLGAPVVVLQAPLLEILAALERATFTPSEPPPPMFPDDFADELRATSSSSSSELAVEGEEAKSSSHHPIPLVRRSLYPQFDAETQPGVGDPGRPMDELMADENGEPVLPLSRAKPSLSPPDEDRYQAVLEGLEDVTEASLVIEGLLEGLSSVAQKVILFTVQGAGYSVRATNFPLAVSEPLRTEGLSSAPDGILDRALRDGHFFGRIPATVPNRPLLQLFGSASGDVYAAPVTVSGKPALGLLLGALKSPALAHRRAERLARAAGLALERIVRAKKALRPS